MTRIEEIWSDLASPRAGDGVLKLLLDPDWEGELSATIQKPQNLPGLLLELSQPIAVDRDSIAASDAFTVQAKADSDGVSSIQLTLSDLKYEEQFGILCNDLVARVLSTENEADGAQLLLKRLTRWVRFLKQRRSGVLSERRQMGLYGELCILNDLLAPVIGFRRAVEAWLGPFGSNQDFQLGEIVIEAKTLAATAPQQLPITNERQLNNDGLAALLLAHISLEPRPNAGRSLPDVIGMINQGLEDEDVPDEEFQDALFESGYFHQHAHIYAQTGYTDRSTKFYNVVAGFPRLVENDLPPGIGKVRYRLDASACDPFSIDRDRVINWLSDAPEAVDPVRSDESDRLEFKATAWKALDGKVPDKVINEAVVKTVAAFLNGSGGTLVIGIRDGDKSVLGIETDLEHLEIDRDAYENRLTRLLKDSLGMASSYATISFEERDEGTVCFVNTKAYPRAVFANSPAQKGKTVFWIRLNNSTYALEGEEMVDYIRNHWG